MANYTHLRFGDTLPTVAILQKLLNRTGSSLKVDGIFGPRTREAVAAFQWRRGLKNSGVVEQATWTRLITETVLPIVDCVDVFDPGLYEGDAKAIMETGAHPILMGGMSRGVVQAALLLRAYSEVFLLRIIGHGSSGWQGVSAGKGGVGEQRAAIHWVNAPNTSTLGLDQIFGDYGNVELHGCHVAAGARGRHFVGMLAENLGVPVTASSATQMSTFRFDGATFTAFPRGQNMKTWCASLPDFTPMSIP